MPCLLRKTWPKVMNEMANNETSFKAACLQVNAGNELAENIEVALALIARAANDGAQLVLMPENVAMMEWGRKAILAKAFPEREHPALAVFREAARAHQVWLHCGSLAVSLPDGRVANRTYVLDPDGETISSYDKIHMFDVNLGEGERYAESSTFAPGEKAVLADLPWGTLGLTICYDLRFPALFRALAQGGAKMITVPAAFTQVTGEAHWHTLLKARAIETGCYIFAPAQTGVHPADRKTYGHALIVDPWGKVIADAGTEAGIISAEINLDLVDRVRKKMPSLEHDRPFADV